MFLLKKILAAAARRAHASAFSTTISRNSLS